MNCNEDMKMDNRNYDRENSNKYVGKWCLFKHFAYSDYYSSVYVFNINDGIIRFAYESDIKCIEYMDEDFVVSPATFFINPVPPNWEPSGDESNCEDKYGGIVYEDPGTYYYMSDHAPSQKDGECVHEWQPYDLTSMPPIHMRSCFKCHNVEKMNDDGRWEPWIGF